MPLFSQYRAMWLFAMFDLPVNDKKSRRAYTQFRKALLKQGFTMMQYSIYARHVPSEEADLSFRRRVRLSLPDDGQVRLMSITDRQFAKMDVFIGRKRKDPEPVPLQRLLF
jgi:CRISPR-associated protein Cas2